MELEIHMTDKLDELLDKFNITKPELNKILKSVGKPGDLEKLLNKYCITNKELETILKSSGKQESKLIKVDIPMQYIKFGYFSDPHVGHERFSKGGFELMSKHFKNEGVEFIVNPGDHLEGMSGRPGHIYELSHIGFDEQITYADELYNSLPDIPHFGIDGNHDQWYAKKNNGGVIVGNELEARIANFNNLGQDEADLVLMGPSDCEDITLRLYHGGDGTAYADSYKLQKLIESFSGGDKPNVVFSGHYHKSLYLARRNVHGFECGTLMGQSRWMRGKKIQAHMGFGTVELYFPKQKGDPMRLKHEWIPLDDVVKTPKKIHHVSVKVDKKK